jgi:hypothetical protein
MVSPVTVYNGAVVYSTELQKVCCGFGPGTGVPKFRNFDEVPKIKKIFLYEMKFVVPNYSCLQNP